MPRSIRVSEKEALISGIVNNGLPRWPVVKNPPASAGDLGSVSALGRPPGEGNSSPVQYSCLGSLMDRGA